MWTRCCATACCPAQHLVLLSTAQHCSLVYPQCPTIRFILCGSVPLLAARHVEVVLPRLTGLCEHLKEPFAGAALGPSWFSHCFTRGGESWLPHSAVKGTRLPKPGIGHAPHRCLPVPVPSTRPPVLIGNGLREQLFLWLSEIIKLIEGKY